mgnify:CR=1 FL=1
MLRSLVGSEMCIRDSINVSSPNTPHLRELQSKSNLSSLLKVIQEENSLAKIVPVLVKIAPDLSKKEIDDIIKVSIKNKIDFGSSNILKTYQKYIVSVLAPHDYNLKLEENEKKLGGNDSYIDLVEEVRLKQIALDEQKEQKKFAGSRVDEAYYYYKKAMHEGENYDVEKATLHSLEDAVNDFDPVIAEKQKILEEAENRLLKVKADQLNLEKQLADLTRKKTQLELTMDFYKPFPFFWRPAEILQTVIPGFGVNSFKEIIYRVDRCMTCHISYQDEHYKDFEQPLKTHPNLDILIKKHPPERTGCTWCHLGQGSATAPAEHAHGSHHEMDQTLEVNEPILHGDYQQATCRNCHAEVVNLEGAPLLSKGKRLFIKLVCHGCHLADVYANQEKVGPSLLRIGSKVDPRWLYRCIKIHKDYLPETRLPEI